MDKTSTKRTRAWLEAEFRQHHQDLLAYARRRVPEADADDVLAEVFTAAWRHRERVPDDALPWLYRTASNYVLHTYRSAARRGRLASRLATFADHRLVADEVVGGGSESGNDELVRAVLARLPAKDAEVLRLDAWEQLAGDDLAYVLGCSPAAARVRLHRARRRFAAAYAAEPTRVDDHDQTIEART